MKKVFVSPTPWEAHHVRNILDADGIAARIHNENIRSAAGEIPSMECYPEVWVLDEAKVERAERLIADFQSQTSCVSGSGWTCERCHEAIGPQFTQCWNCGAERPL
ncbi:MAG: DUF2007 domain-containing protein [Deltaproteobacteria bacterium]|nr:DUF2007 domain-containing protein [Deltaproteobacteria bacterium]